jgi:menaquinone-dependent protoporphyrinogen oxidase
MEKILLLYSTVDGYTKKIATKIQSVLKEQHQELTLWPIDEAINLEAYDKIIIGASIRYGKHHKNVYTFIQEHQKLLEAKPNAFFSVNIVARKPGKNQPHNNPYLIKFLKQIAWQPKNLAVFAGKLDYQHYGIFDRQMIRFIMWMTKGPTDPSSVIEFTDWSEVERFARSIVKI